MRRAFILLTLAVLTCHPGKAAVPAGSSPDPSSISRVVWFDIMTNDAKRAAEFYGQLFGWTYQRVSLRYSVISSAGNPIGGIDEFASATGAGLAIYFPTNDLEGTLERAKSLGAKIVMPPQELAAGRMAMFADPDGNHIGLIEPHP